MESTIDLVEVVLHDVGVVAVPFQIVHASLWPLARLEHAFNVGQVCLAEVQLACTHIRIQVSARKKLTTL